MSEVPKSQSTREALARVRSSFSPRIATSSLHLAKPSVQGYLAHKKDPPRYRSTVGPCSRTIPRVLWWVYRGGGSYERGTPVVDPCDLALS